jgi:hypothetical protein
VHLIATRLDAARRRLVAARIDRDLGADTTEEEMKC